MVRKLTTGLCPYRWGKFEKRTNIGALNVLDYLLEFKISNVAEVLYTQNGQINNEEEAYKKIGEYLSIDGNTVMSLVYDLLEEMDPEMGVLSSFGMTVDYLRNQTNAKIEEMHASLNKSEESSDW